jgi:hypothetical protein
MDKEERYEGKPLQHYDDDNFWKGIIVGLAISLPIWAMFIVVIVSLL